MSAGKLIKHPADVEALVPKVLARLRASASGYVRVSKFKVLDRAALALLIEKGEVETFDSPLGRAYRLTEGQDPELEGR